MKKNSLMIGLFTLLMTFTLGSQSALISLAVPSAFADDDDDDFQETICHFSSGGGNPAETVTVGQPSVLAAHLYHGDTIGACLVCPPGVDICFRGDGKPGEPGPAADAVKATSLRELRGT